MPNAITIGIDGCSASRNHVHKGDMVSFKSEDDRSYVLTDSDGILAGVPARGIDVPKGPNGHPSAAYKVTGPSSATVHLFDTVGDPKCEREGHRRYPPGIIID